MNDRKYIDIDNWERKNHYHFYKDFADPNFNICFQLDISTAYQFSKANDLSIFLVLMYLSSKTCNQIAAYKRRLDKNNKPYEVDVVQPSATVANQDGIFNFCDLQHALDLNDFVSINTPIVERAIVDEPLINVENKANQIFYSITPWLAFTGYKHAKHTSGFDIPKIVFGKIVTENDKSTMPVSIELHHALADAIDIAKYQQAFIENMVNLKTSLN